jgi:hypothetical protein
MLVSMKRHLKSILDVCNTLATVAIAITAIIALIYTYRQINLSRAQGQEEIVQGQTAMLEEMTSKYDSPEMLKSRQKLACERLQDDDLKQLDIDDPPDELYDQLNFFDGVALLEDRGALKSGDIWNNFSYWMLTYNADASLLLAKEKHDDPTAFVEFNKLAAEMQQIAKDRRSPTANPTQDDIAGFYRDDCKVPQKVGKHSRIKP